MLTIIASLALASFLPDPRARVEVEKVARAGKEGSKEITTTHSLSSTYIFPKMTLFPAPSLNRCIFSQDARERSPLLPILVGIYSEDTSVRRAALPPTPRCPSAQGSRHVPPGSTIAPKAAQPYGSPRRAATSRNVKPGKVGNPIGTPPASGAGDRGGNGREQKEIRSVV